MDRVGRRGGGGEGGERWVRVAGRRRHRGGRGAGDSVSARLSRGHRMPSAAVWRGEGVVVTRPAPGPWRAPAPAVAAAGDGAGTAAMAAAAGGRGGDGWAGVRGRWGPSRRPPTGAWRAVPSSARPPRHHIQNIHNRSTPCPAAAGRRMDGSSRRAGWAGRPPRSPRCPQPPAVPTLPRVPLPLCQTHVTVPIIGTHDECTPLPSPHRSCIQSGLYLKGRTMRAGGHGHRGVATVSSWRRHGGTGKEATEGAARVLSAPPTAGSLQPCPRERDPPVAGVAGHRWPHPPMAWHKACTSTAPCGPPCHGDTP